MPAPSTISHAVSEAPPVYEAAPEAAPPPPAFSPTPDNSPLPSSFIVGKDKVTFITVEQVKGHLLLMGAFARLRREVEAQDVKIPPQQRFAVFVAQAVYRFQLYLEKVVQGGTTLGCRPPIDVVLVWHTLQLNPGRWEEDVLRTYPKLRDLSGQLLSKITQAIDPDTFAVKVLTRDIAEWETRLGEEQPYGPLESFRTSRGRHVTLLDTDGTEATVFVPWTTSIGKGYAQQDFSVFHGRDFTHESLGIYKLANDVIACRDDPAATLAGTVISTYATPSKAADSPSAKFVRDRLASDLVGSTVTAVDLAKRMKWSRTGAHASLLHLLGSSSGRGIDTLLQSYSNGDPFSIDLSTAVLRQYVFIDQMATLGFLEPRRFDSDSTVIKRCVARYHAFQDLLTVNTFSVPTLDIDLGWHTHMLTASYVKDVVKSVGRFIDHHDKTRFGLPYSTCGCPLPPVAAKKRFGFSTKSPFSAVYPPSMINLADANETTHPSAHNILTLPLSLEATKRRTAREIELVERQRRANGGDAKGKGKGKGKVIEEKSSSTDHEDAFLGAPFDPNLLYGRQSYPLNGNVNVSGATKGEGTIQPAACASLHGVGVFLGAGSYGFPVGGAAVGGAGGCGGGGS